MARLQPGDILSLNCFPMVQGYYTALERTMFLGHIDQDSLRSQPPRGGKVAQKTSLQKGLSSVLPLVLAGTGRRMLLCTAGGSS